ncbi:MAG: aldo/keto reductase [bacterium]|nr:aldo/keto reductase [bacterium]
MTDSPVADSGTFTLAATSNDPLTVRRLGFGAMRITGAGIWGDPPDRATAIEVLREAVSQGVDFIDTADSYGPAISEDLIREALFPYDGLVIATKGGLTRQGPDRWSPVGRPDYLRQALHMSLRRLGVDRIDLWQLHRIDSQVPADEQFGAIREFVDEGLVRHVGISEVTVDELVAAQRIVDIVSAQNLYNAGDRTSEDLLNHCTVHAIGFIPWFPLGNRALLAPNGPVARVAIEVGCTPAQAALAWLLQRSPVVLPIPGTGSVDHLIENCGAGPVRLTPSQVATIDAIAA